MAWNDLVFAFYGIATIGIDLCEVPHYDGDGTCVIHARTVPDTRTKFLGVKPVEVIYRGKNDQWFCDGIRVDPITSSILKLIEQEAPRYMPVRMSKVEV